jgi:hypothetical protein
MTRVPHVDAGCIRMYHLQFPIAGLQLSLQLPPSRRSSLSPRCRRSKVDNFLFAMAYYLYLLICQARLSWRELNTLSDGVEPGLLQAPLATNP